MTDTRIGPVFYSKLGIDVPFVYSFSGGGLFQYDNKGTPFNFFDDVIIVRPFVTYDTSPGLLAAGPVYLADQIGLTPDRFGSGFRIDAYKTGTVVRDLFGSGIGKALNLSKTKAGGTLELGYFSGTFDDYEGIFGEASAYAFGGGLSAFVGSVQKTGAPFGEEKTVFGIGGVVAAGIGLGASTTNTNTFKSYDQELAIGELYKSKVGRFILKENLFDPILENVHLVENAILHSSLDANEKARVLDGIDDLKFYANSITDGVPSGLSGIDYPGLENFLSPILPEEDDDYALGSGPINVFFRLG